MIAEVDASGRVANLTLAGTVIDFAYLSRVTKFPNLRSLKLSHIGTDPKSLAAVLDGTALTHLELGYGVGEIDDESLIKLASIPTLESLSITTIDPEGKREAVAKIRPELGFTARLDEMKARAEPKPDED